MRILITGGAGCLGSNLIEHWLPLGHTLCVIDNFATGKRELVPEMAGLTLREGSIADAALVDDCMAAFKPDLVVHSAASYKDPNDWAEDVATNVTGAVNIAKSAQAHGVKRIVHFQTNLCFGRPSALPVPNDHAVAPFTSYGISKTAGEQVLMLGTVPVLSLRLANVTGPRLAIGPIPSFYKRLKAGQNCFCSDTARDFMDMSDFLAFMDVAMQLDAPTGVFNLASGEAHTIKEIFDLVAAHLGLPPQDVPVVAPAADDVPVMMLDASAAQKAFNWTPKIGFSDMIARQLSWYDAHGVNDVFSHLKAGKAA
ncbi:MAG: NAD-dependent epimerase/dehydratase family protein [Pseudomonadota bacterium]